MGYLWSHQIDPVIIGTNAAGFVLNVSLLVMKLRYDKMQNNTRKNWLTFNEIADYLDRVEISKVVNITTD